MYGPDDTGIVTTPSRSIKEACNQVSSEHKDARIKNLLQSRQAKSISSTFRGEVVKTLRRFIFLDALLVLPTHR